MRAAVSSLLACALTALTVPAAHADFRIRLDVRRVVDGDTFIANGDRWRPTGFDTPEISRRNARCDREIELGKLASKAATDELKKAAVIEAEPLIDSQTGGFMRDGRGRILARVFVDGTPMQDHLYTAGLARPWSGPPEPKPDWCDGQPLFKKARVSD